MHELYTCKTAIIGDSIVGKTSITRNFLTGGTNFSRNYVMTSDVSLNAKDILIEDTADAVELLLYDSAGSSLYTDFLPKFWSGINAIFAVFDVTSENSFESLRSWIKMAVVESPFAEVETDYFPPGIIFGNKTDLDSRRVISSERAKALAIQLGFEYFEGSAKNNINIEESFIFLANALHKVANENSI